MRTGWEDVEEHEEQQAEEPATTPAYRPVRHYPEYGKVQEEQRQG